MARIKRTGAGKSKFKGFYNSFKSGLEYEAGDFLRAREDRYGYVSRYEPERLRYSYEGTYKPDFVLTFSDGYKIYIETKGYMDNDARRKMASVRKANPNLDIRFVFARDHQLRKNLPMTYSKWATKVGFPWAIKTIPESWLIDPEGTSIKATKNSSSTNEEWQASQDAIMKSPEETAWKIGKHQQDATSLSGKMIPSPSNISEDVDTDSPIDTTG